MKISSLFLIGPTGLVLAASPFTHRHMAAVNEIPRFPLVLLKGERHLQGIDLSKFGGEGMEMDCDFHDTNGMECTMTVGDHEYDIVENCDFKEDGMTISCEVCTDEMEADDFHFCYEIDCNFSAFLDDPDNIGTEASVAQMEGEVCQCKYAQLNGDFCTYCGICPLTDDQAVDVSSQLFSNLAVECPKENLVASACDASEAVSSGSKGITMLDNAPGSDDERKVHPGASAAIAVLAFVVLGLVVHILVKMPDPDAPRTVTAQTTVNDVSSPPAATDDDDDGEMVDAIIT